MDEYDDIGPSFTILPGVDLALWLRLMVVVLLVLGGGVAVAIVR